MKSSLLCLLGVALFSACSENVEDYGTVKVVKEQEPVCEVDVKDGMVHVSASDWPDVTLALCNQDPLLRAEWERRQGFKSLQTVLDSLYESFADAPFSLPSAYPGYFAMTDDSVIYQLPSVSHAVLMNEECAYIVDNKLVIYREGYVATADDGLVESAMYHISSRDANCSSCYIEDSPSSLKSISLEKENKYNKLVGTEYGGSYKLAMSASVADIEKGQKHYARVEIFAHNYVRHRNHWKDTHAAIDFLCKSLIVRDFNGSFMDIRDKDWYIRGTKKTVNYYQAKDFEYNGYGEKSPSSGFITMYGSMCSGHLCLGLDYGAEHAF